MTTIEEREKIVEEWRSSGMTMKEWCPEHNIKVRTLENYSWKYNKNHGLAKTINNPMKSGLVELIPTKASCSKLIVEVGRCRISVDSQTDLNLLKKVTSVLGND